MKRLVMLAAGWLLLLPAYLQAGKLLPVELDFRIPAGLVPVPGPDQDDRFGIHIAALEVNRRTYERRTLFLTVPPGGVSTEQFPYRLELKEGTYLAEITFFNRHTGRFTLRTVYFRLQKRDAPAHRLAVSVEGLEMRDFKRHERMLVPGKESTEQFFHPLLLWSAVDKFSRRPQAGWPALYQQLRLRVLEVNYEPFIFKDALIEPDYFIPFKVSAKFYEYAVRVDNIGLLLDGLGRSVTPAEARTVWKNISRETVWLPQRKLTDEAGYRRTVCALPPEQVLPAARDLHRSLTEAMDRRFFQRNHVVDVAELAALTPAQIVRQIQILAGEQRRTAVPGAGSRPPAVREEKGMPVNPAAR